MFKFKNSKLLIITMSFIIFFVFCGSVAAEYEIVTLDHAISFTGAKLNDPIDGMWQGMKVDNEQGGALLAHPEGISGDGTYLNLKGYQTGGNVQYAYMDTEELHNKIIKMKLKFDGEMAYPDASFIAFVFRAKGYSSKFFWDESCYAILIKGGKVEAQKFPQRVSGVYNNLGGPSGKTPIVKNLDTPFTPGLYDIEVGAVDGISPNTGKEAVNLILRINGKEVLNEWDDSGRTPILTNKGYFMIALCATQADSDIAGDTTSRSSVTIYKTGATGEVVPQETKATTSTQVQTSEVKTTITETATESTIKEETTVQKITSEKASESETAKVEATIESTEEIEQSKDGSTVENTEGSSEISKNEDKGETSTELETIISNGEVTETDETSDTESNDGINWAIIIAVIIVVVILIVIFVLRNRKKSK